MKKNTITLLILAGLGAGSPGLFALEGDAGNRRGPGAARAEARPPHRLMAVARALDANRDATLSAEEIANAPAALRGLDANGDGSLTPEELRPKPPVPRDAPASDGAAERSGRDRPRGGTEGRSGDRRPGRAGSPFVRAIDADRDGTLSSDEIESVAAALKTLDKNGDGAITPDEIHPRGRGGRHEGSGGDGAESGREEKGRDRGPGRRGGPAGRRGPVRGE